MTKRRIAVLDLETDPFRFRRIPQPFAWGYYDGDRFICLFDDSGALIDRSVEILKREKPTVIYAHNGGKFDWFYYLPFITRGSSLRVVNGRIIQAFLGHHEIRDSYAIMPFALEAYRKTKIDYDKFERNRRHKYKDEILSYLRDDCVDLFELVSAYWQEFGDVLTIGSASMHELKRFSKFSCGGQYFDEKFRSQYYFGGRVQVLGPVTVNESLKVLDVNSMYPYVMAYHKHPVSAAAEVSTRIEKKTCFVTAIGDSYGAFPVRTKTGIEFPHGYGTYAVTIHEWEAAEDTGSFRCHKILKTYAFDRRETFEPFINHFYLERKAAKAKGDKIHDLFYKYVLNSAYGKFAQNPLNYWEYEITGMEDRPEPWELAAIAAGDYMLWRRPILRPVYHNICTAASITGAARAILLRGLCDVKRAYYCDTDSIICHDSGSVALHDSDLGKWKVEVTASGGVFPGKKIYALFDAKGTCVKKAHKGFQATGEEIREIAQGKTLTFNAPVPHFKMSGEHGFVTRQIRSTVNGR